MPTHPGRDPLTGDRILAFEEILRLGLTTLTTKHREILDEDKLSEPEVFDADSWIPPALKPGKVAP